MPLQQRNSPFGTSSADCDVIRAKGFFSGFWVIIARSFQEAQKKFKNSEQIEIVQFILIYRKVDCFGHTYK